MGLDRLLAASFPVPGGAEEDRRAFAADVDHDFLGLGIYQEGSGLHFASPVTVLAGSKPTQARV